MTSNYDKHPIIDFSNLEKGLHGYEKLSTLIEATGDNKVVFELYPGVDKVQVKNFVSTLDFDLVIDTDDLKKSQETLKKEFDQYITDDRVFGFMCHKNIVDAFDKEKLSSAKQAANNSNSVAVIGTGASLVLSQALILYFDISRWEIQLRYRNGLSNWLFNNDKEPVLHKYKIGYFIEWRMADKLKMSIFENIAYFVDTHEQDKPKFVSGCAVREALKQLPQRPFRMEPYFDPGVWGGQWMKEKFNLPNTASNYAWSFDGVPEENAINLRFGEEVIKLPTIDLVLYQSENLLGSKVYGRYGAEFPIRFDLLDTMQGGNLSLQVHPLTSYIQENFGMNYTQDESYYLLDAQEDANVYLGLKKTVNKEEMIADLREAQIGKKPFEAEKYVNKIPAKKHDHFLIPGGTVHCSGAGSMVLEISATPYIFTFKLWDWGRVGLDGIPRPIHIDHGSKNIQFNRDTDFVFSNLVNHFQVLEETDSYKIELTGLDVREPIITHRYTVKDHLDITMDNSVQMLNLVEGNSCLIESLDNSFDAFEVHYAETFIIPAKVGRYRIRTLHTPIILIEARIR